MRKSAIYTPIASAARTTTFNHDLGEMMGDWDEVALYLNVTAASGTSPTLDVAYQTKADGVWYTHTSFTQATTTTTEKKIITQAGVDSRILCTIGGTTPSFTFTVSAEVKRTGSV